MNKGSAYNRSNRVTDLLGIKYPIIQGPFGGGFSTVDLVSTISNLGGLGSFGAHQLNAEEIQSLCKKIRKHTDNPFAINLWVSNSDDSMLSLTHSTFIEHRDAYSNFYNKLDATPPTWPEQQSLTFEQQVEGVLRAKPRVFSFVFGIPSKEILSECKHQDILTLGAATTIEEASTLEEAGVDLILATGFEAGGHRPSFLKTAENSLIGNFALIPAIRDAVKVPVIAGGGIADRRGVRAALALGADAVQVGSAFLASNESGASKIHKTQLLNNTEGNTILSRAYSGRLARFIPNKITQYHSESNLPTLPFPAQSWLTSPIKDAAIIKNDTESMPLYAGQIAPLLYHSSAKTVMDELLQGL